MTKNNVEIFAAKSNPRHQTAVRYATQGLPVFPCVVNGKKPATPNGFKDATTDLIQIDAWWAKADYNVAICPEDCGWAVIDTDPGADPAWLAKLPPTYAVQTPRGGRHLYFEGSLPSSVQKLAPHVDTRGGMDGKPDGYVLVAPSVVDGKPYQVIDGREIEPLPAWVTLPDKAKPKREAPPHTVDHHRNIARAITHLQRLPTVSEKSGADAATYKAACVLRDLGLSADMTLELMREHYKCEPRDGRFESFLQAKVEHAFEYGQNVAGADADHRTGSEVFANSPAVQAEVAVADGALDWPVLNLKTGKPTKCPVNTEYFLQARGVRVFRDAFSGLTHYGDGQTRNAELEDDAMRRLHQQALRSGYDITKDAFTETVLDVALHDQRHPVQMYLDGLLWDGAARLDNWLTTYGGAPDNAYTRAVGKLLVVSAVRRVRKPGCKADSFVILEGAQGLNKSKALRIMAGDAWFTDTVSLGDDPKVMIEQTRGKWIVEVPELGGMARRDVDAIKAQLSRQADRARLAYGRSTTEVARQFILVGTNNPDVGVGYLKDTTGNRRFLPVPVTGFDQDALARDRDQLWAEAAHAEMTYGELALPQALWAEAAKVQENRREKDPMEARLADALTGVKGFIPTEAIYSMLGLGTGDGNRGVEKRRAHHDRLIAMVMKQHGWRRDRQCPPSSRNARRGYAKGTSAKWLICWGDTFAPHDTRL
jgi:hypothetical protein